MKILVIEDEIVLAKSILAYLAEESYVCESAHSFAQAMYKINTYDYACILLDIMLLDGDGMKILEELKKMDKQEGVIVISAKNSLEDKVKGLQLGADDYLAKPFHLAELSARVFSVIRRKKFGAGNIVKQNEISVDLVAKTVWINDLEVTLTKREFDLLTYFMGNKNRVISKSTLAEHLSGDIADVMDNHDFVYTHIKNLKKKMSDAQANMYLKTIYGTGYKWEG